MSRLSVSTLGFFLYICIMIINSKKPTLTLEYILSIISEYDIYCKYIGFNVQLGSAIKSPLRKDKNPSFVIRRNKSGKLYHKDYGSADYSGGCIDFVMQLFGVNYNDALLIVDKDFGLGIKNKTVMKTRIHFEEPISKDRADIQVKAREQFTKSDLDYWKRFYIDEDTLFDEEVYSVERLYINGKRVFIPSSELIYAYSYLGGKYFKIYRPNGEKRSKWLTNVPSTLIDGLEDLDLNLPVLIQKSKKDKMCTRLVYDNVCSVQNESISAFLDEDNMRILSKAKKLYLIFDPDESGVIAQRKVLKLINASPIIIPGRLYEEKLKDFADITEKYGPSKIKEILSNKSLLLKI